MAITFRATAQTGGTYRSRYVESLTFQVIAANEVNAIAKAVVMLQRVLGPCNGCSNQILESMSWTIEPVEPSGYRREA